MRFVNLRENLTLLCKRHLNCNQFLFLDIFISMKKIVDYKVRFNSLMESSMGNVKPLIVENPTPTGRNNPDWVNLRVKAMGLPFKPKVITFGTDDQSLNWGSAKSAKGNYALVIDDKSPYFDLFTKEYNSDSEKSLHQWWADNGYEVDTTTDRVKIDIKNIDKLMTDLKSFFDEFPPE